MEHIDEYEMQIEYSEMTTFNFKSKEYQEVRKDYIECKNRINNFSVAMMEFFDRFKKLQNC